MFVKRARWTVAVVLVILFADACWSQSLPLNSCSSKSSCGECIRSADCHWCLAVDHRGPRCFVPDINEGDRYCREFMTSSDNALYHDSRTHDYESTCRHLESVSYPICSNRGTCDCGICRCDKVDNGTISGPYCECDNFSCDLNKGVLCSGNGRCVCGKCLCERQYTGSACDCLLDQSPCVSPENGKICSGNGHCSCGKCVCTADGDKHYSGDYCEKCLTCPGRCAEFKDCVLCEVHARGPMLQGVANDTQCGECSLHPIIVQGNLEANETIGEHLCSFYDNEDCLYAYVYSYDAMEQLVIRAQKGRECPPKVFVLGIVLGAIAATVLVGMALLMLWKLATTIHDRREFARFENEQMKAQWETAQNPIYKEATTTFKNPTYCEN